MMKPHLVTSLSLVLLSLLFPSHLTGQVNLHGQFSTSLLLPWNSSSTYESDDEISTFVWHGILLIDARAGESGVLRGTFSMDQEQKFHVDRLSLAFPVSSKGYLDIEAGVIDLPFLNLGARRYAWNNTFPGLPLMNEVHTTALMDLAGSYELPLNWDQKGPYLVDGGLYDLGVRIGGAAGSIDYGVAIVNGMVGMSGLYSPTGVNVDSDFGFVARIGWTPITGLTAGISGATGTVQNELEYTESLYTAYASPSFIQNIVGADIEFETGYLSVYGQYAFNEFNQWTDIPFRSRGYSVEARYALTPRISLAARFGGIVFSPVSSIVLLADGKRYNNIWDFDRTRLEGSLGYRISREIIVRLMLQSTRFSSPSPMSESSVFVIQIATSL